MSYQPICNKEEHLEALARLCAGAEYIESDHFSHLSKVMQEKAKKRYDTIEREILVFQGMKWAINK